MTGHSLFGFAFVLKFASDGNLVWEKGWTVQAEPGMGFLDIGNSVAVTGDGSVYVAGEHTTFPAPPGRVEAFLLKLDTNGELIWQRSWQGIGHARAWDTLVAFDGSIYVVGETSDLLALDRRAFLSKFAPDGGIVWQRTWRRSSTEPSSFARAHGVTADSQGNLFVTGRSGFIGRAFEGFLLKFSSDGTLLWQRTWDSQDFDSLSDAVATSDGSVYVTGSTSTLPLGGPDTVQKLVLLRFTADGQLIWQRTWLGEGFSGTKGNGVSVGSSGGIFVVGSANIIGLFGQADAMILRITDTGDVVWARRWFGPANVASSAQTFSPIDEEAFTIAVGPEETLYVAGQAYNPPPYVFQPVASIGLSEGLGSVGLPDGLIESPEAPWAVPNGIMVTPEGSLTFVGLEGVSDAFLLRVTP